MRVSTSIALLLLAAVTANAAMYIPSGAYCGSNGMKVLVAGTNLLIRSQEDVEKTQQMRLYVHQVSGTGNVTLTNTVVGNDDYGRISSVMWDAYSKSLLVTALTRGWTVSSYYAATNLTAAACPAATSVYLPSGVMCSSSATLVTSADLMLLASSTASSTAACGGTYSLSTTNSPFSNQVGTCPGTVSYMSYDSTAGVVYARATVSGGYRYSVALSAATCGATPTMLPNTTSWCPASSVSSTSPWAKSVLVFDNVNNLFSWVPKYTSGQECIRIGTYSTQGSTVDLLTVTDQCSGGSIASPAGLIYSATGSTLTFKDSTDTSVTFSPCTVAADPVIPSGWTCGGTGAGMVVVGTTFIVRPDVNTNAGTDPMTMQCVVAGTFQSTTGMTWATTTSSASTCGSTVSSITIGLSNATTAVKSVWFNMIRGGYLEGYTFASDLCTVAPVAVASKIYNVSLSNGAWGPLVVDSSSYATLVANGSWSGTSCTVLFAGAQLSVRSGRVSFVVNATNAMCFTTLVLFDVQISTTAALSFNVGTTYSSALWTTTMTPTAGSLDGMYCGALQSTLTVTGSDYIYREPGTIVIGSLWGSGADWWANVQGYTSGSSGINVLHIGSVSGVLTISLSNGATKTMSATQCTATTAWSYPATASYCASNVLGMSLSLSTALGGFSLALIDPTKSTQCAISGQLVVGPSGVTTFATMISSLTCPTNLGVFSIAFGTSGLTAVVSNGTSTASVTATSSSCATTPLANGLYCQPNTTLLDPTSVDSVFVMIAGNELTLSTGWIISTNFTLNSTGAIVLDQFQPVSIAKTFWFTAVGSGATTSGIWYSTSTSNTYLTQANCGAATATNPSTWNTIMTTAAPVAELGAVTPVLVFDYTSYILYFPNATSTSYDCTIQGTYSVSNMIASYSFTISASCPTLNNITGITATTSGVTVGLIVGGKAVSIDFAASNCKATGVATAGRHCASMWSVATIYTCADLYFGLDISGSAPLANGMTRWTSTLTSFGKLMASTATNTTAWPSARITGVPSQGNTMSITAGTGDLLWANDALNSAVQSIAASFCSASLTTAAQVAASWPANMYWQQYLPVGPYCGKRTGDTSVIATSFPMVLSQTLISLPNNTVYLNLTAPGQLQACTVTGNVVSVRPGTGEAVISFSTSSTGQGCTFGGLYTQSYTQFTSAYFTAATNTLSLTGFTFGSGAPAPFSYTLAGGNCADRVVAVAATPAMPMVQTIQQGTFNGTTPTASITLVTIGNVFALSLTTATGVTSAGGTYANTTVTPSTSSAVTPLMFTINSVNGLTFYNASALPSAGYAPTLDILSGVEYVTVLGYLGQSASVSGAAAGDSSSSDDDNKKKVIIAVIAVVAVAAVVGLALMLKRGGGGSRGTGQREGDGYQQMTGSKV